MASFPELFYFIFQMSKKSEIRKYIKGLTKSKSVEEKREASEKVIAKLESTPLFCNAKTVMLFHSLPDEVCTHELIDKYAGEKRIVLPALIDCPPYWQLREYTSQNDLKMGAFNIMEPVGKLFEDYGSIDLVVVPGLAFSLKGKRVGRGKGYYDRILSAVGAPTIAICFPWQILEDEEIECDEWDISMDNVLDVR